MDFSNLKKTFIIAEIGNNHEGNFSLAKKLIVEAKKSGADAVKFQTFIPDCFVSVREKERIKKLNKFQLSFDEFKKLSIFAKKNKINFFSTPLDLKSAKFLNSIQQTFKIASSDSNFSPLLRLIASFNKNMILSSGMTEMNTIKTSKNLIFNIWKKNKKNKKKLILMHCVSSYPTPHSSANLLAIKTLEKTFKDCIIGYSDHTIGISAATTAVVLGAKVIEKHFTIDKNFSDFRDHQLSSDPKEMRELVERIRTIEVTLGDGVKKIENVEKKTLNYMRRSAYSSRNIPKGKKISKDDIKWIRSNKGMKISFEKNLFKKKSKRLIKKNQIIYNKDLI